MGQINNRHAGEGEESEARGGKVWEATGDDSGFIGWLNVSESGWEVSYVDPSQPADVKKMSSFPFVCSMTSTFLIVYK